jgi:hypothetical protein
MYEATFYFVNCDCLEQLVTSRGLPGEWRGGDHYKVFYADNGSKLCWFVDTLQVLGAGENLGVLTSELPELIPWDDATPEVGEKMRELRESKEEILVLKKRLCII